MKKKILMIAAVILLLVLAIYFITSSKNVWTSDKDTADFKLIFTENKNIGKKKIISENSLNKNSYNVYLYNGEVKVIIGEVEYDLKTALQTNKLTTQDIVNKAQKEAKNNGGWSDGGSILYIFDNYQILKYNTLMGNKDLYIGSKDLNYSIGEN